MLSVLYCCFCERRDLQKRARKRYLCALVVVVVVAICKWWETRAQHAVDPNRAHRIPSDKNFFFAFTYIGEV